MVRDRMLASQSRQKAYADRKRRPLEFAAGDHVFLRVTRTTGVGRALRSRKLSPKFLGPYQITRRIGPVAYEIALPPQLANLHPVFHVVCQVVGVALRTPRLRCYTLSRDVSFNFVYSVRGTNF